MAKDAHALMSCAKMIADSFASVSDEAFEAMLQQMRDERREWRAVRPRGDC